MEKFYQYTVEELILNDAFREWVLSLTPTQEAEFRQWIESNPVESQKLVTAADIIRSVRITNTGLSESEQSEAVQQIFERTTRKGQTQKSRPLYHWGFAAAAVLAVLIGFYLLPSKYYSRESAIQQSDSGWKWNHGSHARLIQLADGSSIFLKPGSAVRYPDIFEADARKVELQGEAFFEVAPDKSKPFYVYAGGAVTKVLGTSFSVRALGNEENTVIGVRSGKVSVSRMDAGQDTGTAQVMPGQQAIVSRNKQGILKSALGSDDEISQFLKSAANGKNIEVVHYLGIARTAFDLEISFDPKRLKSCRVRANFEGMHLMEQIDAICKAINASYVVRNGQVIITSRGC